MKTIEQLGISPAPWTARKVSREEGSTGLEVYDDNGNYVLSDGDAGFAKMATGIDPWQPGKTGYILITPKGTKGRARNEK